MKLIALTGAIASGKSSVAHALADRGYLVVEHADLLKKLLTQALAGINIILPMEAIRGNKAKYRTLLQELGTVIGFDSGDYLVRALVEAGWEGPTDPRPVVIDNVRTDGQAQIARANGFKVVRLNVSNFTRWDRLMAQGVSIADIDHHERHPIEGGISPDLIDYHVTSDVLTPDGFAELLIGLGEEDDAQANQ